MNGVLKNFKAWSGCRQDIFAGYGFDCEVTIVVSFGLQGELDWLRELDDGVRNFRAGRIGYGSGDRRHLRQSLSVPKGCD